MFEGVGASSIAHEYTNAKCHFACCLLAGCQLPVASVCYVGRSPLRGMGQFDEVSHQDVVV